MNPQTPDRQKRWVLTQKREKNTQDLVGSIRAKESKVHVSSSFRWLLDQLWKVGQAEQEGRPRQHGASRWLRTERADPRSAAARAQAEAWATSAGPPERGGPGGLR